MLKLNSKHFREQVIDRNPFRHSTANILRVVQLATIYRAWEYQHFRGDSLHLKVGSFRSHSISATLSNMFLALTSLKIELMWGPVLKVMPIETPKYEVPWATAPHQYSTLSLLVSRRTYLLTLIFACSSRWTRLAGYHTRTKWILWHCNVTKNISRQTLTRLENQERRHFPIKKRVLYNSGMGWHLNTVNSFDPHEKFKNYCTS